MFRLGNTYKWKFWQKKSFARFAVSSRVTCFAFSACYIELGALRNYPISENNSSTPPPRHDQFFIIRRISKLNMTPFHSILMMGKPQNTSVRCLSLPFLTEVTYNKIFLMRFKDIYLQCSGRRRCENALGLMNGDKTAGLAS